VKFEQFGIVWGYFNVNSLIKNELFALVNCDYWRVRWVACISGESLQND